MLGGFCPDTSFQIVSEFIVIFVKFSNFMSRGGALDSIFCPEGRVFVHNDCPGGRVFAPFKSCPGGDGFGEIDTCIILLGPNILEILPRRGLSGGFMS